MYVFLHKQKQGEVNKIKVNISAKKCEILLPLSTSVSITYSRSQFCSHSSFTVTKMRFPFSTIATFHNVYVFSHNLKINHHIKKINRNKAPQNRVLTIHFHILKFFITLSTQGASECRRKQTKTICLGEIVSRLSLYCVTPNAILIPALPAFCSAILLVNGYCLVYIFFALILFKFE